MRGPPDVRRAPGQGRPRELIALEQSISSDQNLTEGLRQRQALRLASWCHISLPVANVVAELAWPAGRQP